MGVASSLIAVGLTGMGFFLLWVIYKGSKEADKKED